jgi:hypothetical protein
MSTRDIIQEYFERLRTGGDWAALLSEDVAFANLASPVKRVAGKAAFLEATRRFYGSVASLGVRDLVVEGERACALTKYRVAPPTRDEFESHVAEFFDVQNGRIAALSICFDTAPYPRR